MQETAETGPLQLLFIELRVGLARSAIQAAAPSQWRRQRRPPPLPGKFAASGGRSPAGEPGAAKMGIAVFGVGLFIPGITLVNAYVAQDAIASGRSRAFGNTMRRLGLNLIVASLFLFLAGIALVVLAI
jgi:hypothetical protein